MSSNTIIIALPYHYHLITVPMLTGGNNGATVIGGSIGGMVLIAVIMAIIF